jgi:hypothetical protein
MTSVLERERVTIVDVLVDEPVSRPDGVPVALAAVVLGAATIHAAMTPSHLGEWTAEGVAFLGATVAQVAIGGLLLRRSTKGVLAALVALHVLLIGAWVVSRTTGLPFGPEAHETEAVGVVDGICVALEAAAIVLALGRPLLRRAGGALAVGVPLLAVVATSAALLSPSARNHAHAHGGVVIGKGFEALHNGHHAEIAAYTLDPASKRALDAQLDVTRRVARRFPTVAAAEAAGYRRAGPYAPGLGAHYVLFSAKGLNPDGRMDLDDLESPQSLQFAGTDPDSKLAGFMYYSVSAAEPEGFVGRNDVWHYHKSLCLRFRGGQVEAPFGADNDATKAQCDGVGGTLLKQTQWMLHVWSVPGWENRAGGVFGENNPRLACPDGTYHRRPAEEWADHPLNVCVS